MRHVRAILGLSEPETVRLLVENLGKENLNYRFANFADGTAVNASMASSSNMTLEEMNSTAVVTYRKLKKMLSYTCVKKFTWKFSMIGIDDLPGQLIKKSEP